MIYRQYFKGGQAGTVISLPISGVLADELGWDWIFYVFGGLGCIWFVFWCFLVYEEPSHHPRITEVTTQNSNEVRVQ